MASTGYSGTSLAKKLGIKPGDVVRALDAPDNYAELLARLPDGVQLTKRLAKDARFVHVFATERGKLERVLEQLRNGIAADGTIWVSWPKKASKMPTDITEDVIREVSLPLGLVDVKVRAVDDIWSGLKLVVRKELR